MASLILHTPHWPRSRGNMIVSAAIAASVTTGRIIVVHSTEHLFICIRQLYTHQLILSRSTLPINTTLAIHCELWSKREWAILKETFACLFYLLKQLKCGCDVTSRRQRAGQYDCIFWLMDATQLDTLSSVAVCRPSLAHQPHTQEINNFLFYECLICLDITFYFLLGLGTRRCHFPRKEILIFF